MNTDFFRRVGAEIQPAQTLADAQRASDPHQPGVVAAARRALERLGRWIAVLETPRDWTAPSAETPTVPTTLTAASAFTSLQHARDTAKDAAFYVPFAAAAEVEREAKRLCNSCGLWIWCFIGRFWAWSRAERESKASLPMAALREEHA